MTLEHIIMALAGLAMAAYAVVKGYLGGRNRRSERLRDRVDEADQEADEKLEQIEEQKHEQVDDYTSGGPGDLADDAQSVIDGLRSGD